MYIKCLKLEANQKLRNELWKSISNKHEKFQGLQKLNYIMEHTIKKYNKEQK